jgi:hypothetical protein
LVFARFILSRRRDFFRLFQGDGRTVGCRWGLPS